jgi:calcium-dependent protein kinase
MGCANSNIKKNEKNNINMSPSILNRVKKRNSNFIKNSILSLENKGSLPKYYKIIEKIGKGCFGKVYKVFHHESGQYRALKVIKRETINYQDDNRQFLKEIEALSQIDHPNIIKIFEYFIAEQSYFVLVELARGYELMDTIIELNHFSENQAAFIMEQLFSCISYLHSKGIIHRDLKPENIMTESKNIGDLNIKLIDFGSAYILSKSNNYTSKLKLKIGTPYYMAPEVINGHYDSKCDIWSLGVIMYVLLSGEPPFFGEDDADTFELVKMGRYQMNGKQWDKVSVKAKNLINKLLTYDPKERISAEEALNDSWISSYSKGKKNDINLQIKNKITKFSSLHKLQQSILSFLIHNYSSNEFCKELKVIFKKLDTSGDGRLSYDELKSGFNKYFIGYNLTDDELLELIKSIDKDNSMFIEYEEFLTAFLNKELILTEKNLNNAFSHFDDDKSGKLSILEIKKVLGFFEEDEESMKLMKTMIKEHDVNGDGEISLEEFKNLMRKIINI